MTITENEKRERRKISDQKYYEKRMNDPVLHQHQLKSHRKAQKKIDEKIMNDPVLHQRRLEVRQKYRDSHREQIRVYNAEYNQRPNTKIIKNKSAKRIRNKKLD